MMFGMIAWDVFVLVTITMIAVISIVAGVYYAKYNTLKLHRLQQESLKEEPSCADFCAHYNVGCEAEMFNSRFECEHFEPRKVERPTLWDISTGKVTRVQKVYNPRTGEYLPAKEFLK